VEELLRKLLLSAVVVLIEEGSPLQVTLAVLVSGWAHVLHAMYKPWGAGSVLYSLQHGALFVTSFVFLMGMLFKVDGVSSSSKTYTALSGVMVTLCTAFMAAWVAIIMAHVVSLWRDMRSGRIAKQVQPRTGSSAATVTRPIATLTDVSANHGANDGDGAGVMGRGTVTSSASAGPDFGVVASTASDVTDPQIGVPGFIVENPLRRNARTAASGVGVPARAGAGDGDAATLQSTHSSAPAVNPRLQRVLTAQQPVLTARRVV
jgi:hypothetical protein